jgi:hypothetical protein
MQRQSQARIPLPESLPDERLYSRLCRYAVLSAEHRGAATLATIYGAARANVQSDLPSRLDYLGRFFGPALLLDEAIEENTQLPYFRAACGPQRYARLKQLAVDGRVGRLTHAAGLPASYIGLRRPMRLCPACVVEDRATQPVAYWRRAHQLPGVLVCFKHESPLHEPVASDRRQRPALVLPDDLLAAGRARPIALPNAAHALLVALAQRSRALLLPETETAFEPQTAALFVSARAAGWLTRSGSVRSRVWPEVVRASLEPLQALDEFGWADLAGRAQWVPELFRASGAFIHPLKVLLVQLVLEQAATSPEIRSRAAERQAVFAPARRRPKPVASSMAISMAVVQEIADKKSSLRSTAAAAGVSVQTARIYAARAGLVVGRRPKRLTFEIREQIKSALQDGQPIAAICKSMAISNSSVWRVLVESPALHKAHADASLRRERETRRARWLAHVDCARLDPARRRAARAHDPSTYAWLYRHDRAWLFGATSESQAQ